MKNYVEIKEKITEEPNLIETLEFPPLELCYIALEKNANILEKIKRPLNYKMCLIAVSNKECCICETFKYIPNNFKDENLCLAAIYSCGYAWEHFPNKFKTEEYFRIAEKTSPKLGNDYPQYF